MLKQRVITALILAPLVLLALFYLPLQSFTFFVCFVVALAGWEWARLAGQEHQIVRGAFGLVLSLLVWYFAANILPAYVLVAIPFWLFALFAVLYYPQNSFWQRAGIPWLLGILVILPFAFGLLLLKQYQFQSQLIVFILALVWGADIGAYFSGRRFGKTKLAKDVSPGKSWEGVYGGIAAVALIALIWSFWHQFTLQQSIIWVLFTVLLGFISVLGDLFESMLKRSRNIKDSSQLLPGHGGILDRVDSLTAAVPCYAAGLLLLGEIYPQLLQLV